VDSGFSARIGINETGSSITPIFIILAKQEYLDTSVPSTYYDERAKERIEYFDYQIK
jgi:hypothetical protein